MGMRQRTRGPHPLDRGYERATVHTFDATPFTGGAIEVCSEYGFVKLAGVSGRQGRVAITVTFADADRSLVGRQARSK